MLLAACLTYAGSAICEAAVNVGAHAMISVDEEDNERTVDVHVDDLLRISLPENATTGYRWAVDHYDRTLIEAVSSEPVYKGDAIGSGGRVEFIFKGRQGGAGEIVLKYWRHWEGDSSITKRYRLHLDVHP